MSCVHCVKVTVQVTLELRSELCALCDSYCLSNFHTVHTAHDATPHDHSEPQPTHPRRTPHAVAHGLILLMMGIMMPETC